MDENRNRWVTWHTVECSPFVTGNETYLPYGKSESETVSEKALKPHHIDPAIPFVCSSEKHKTTNK